MNKRHNDFVDKVGHYFREFEINNHSSSEEKKLMSNLFEFICTLSMPKISKIEIKDKLKEHRQKIKELKELQKSSDTTQNMHSNKIKEDK